MRMRLANGFSASSVILRRCIFVLTLLSLSLSGVIAGQASPQPSAPAAATPERSLAPDAHGPVGYQIGAGDVLQISVWNEPQASVQAVVVRPDGKISLPLVKELSVLGLTPVDLEKVLTTKLGQLIHGADVTVVVKEIHSKKVYLIGAVKKEGPVPLLSPMTVLQVLAEAGGLNEFAKKKKIYVLRTENGKQVKLPFDYEAAIKGERIDQNITVLPDDTIVVP